MQLLNNTNEVKIEKRKFEIETVWLTILPHNRVKRCVVFGKIYREILKSAALFVGILTIITVGLRLTPNKRFYEMLALPRVDNICVISRRGSR